MNTVERNWLLMEVSGLDSSKEAPELSNRLFNSAVFNAAQEGLARAAKTKRPSALRNYNDIRDLDFSVSTIADYSRLEANVLLFYVKARPQSWVNPLDNDNAGQDEVNSIGQLYAYEDGNPTTIDQLIADKELSFAAKENALALRVFDWQRDVAQKATEQISQIKGGVGWERRQHLKTLVYSLRLSLLLIANLLSVALFLVPSEDFRLAFYNPNSADIISFVIYIPLIFTLIYDVIYVWWNTMDHRLNQSLSYSRRFVFFNSRKFFSELAQNSQELMADIESHLKAKTPMGAGSLWAYPLKYGSQIAGREEKSVGSGKRNFLSIVFVVVTWLTFFAVLFAMIAISLLADKGLFA